MIALASILVPAAKAAGMKVPEDPDNFDGKEFPHFDIFVKAQIGKATRYHGEHWDNAKMIADLSDEKVKEITIEGLMAKGFSW